MKKKLLKLKFCSVFLMFTTLNTNVYGQEKDTQHPSMPTNIVIKQKNNSNVIDYSNIYVSWTASTDNIGVTEYEVYQNGNLIGTTTTTNYTVTTFKPNTKYTFTIIAKDAAGNKSLRAGKIYRTEYLYNFASKRIEVGRIEKTSVEISWTIDARSLDTFLKNDLKLKLFKNGEYVALFSKYDLTINNNIGYQSYTFTNLKPNTDYVFTLKTVDKQNNISGDKSSSIIIRTKLPTYCSSRSDYVKSAYIVKVESNTISNSSGKSNYSEYDYSNHAPYKKGEYYSLTITPRFEGAPSYPEGYAAWIDFNGNGIFENKEIVLATGVTHRKDITAIFKVPEDAKIGRTKMRVSMKWDGAPSPCENLWYGEVEDYFINIANNNYKTPCLSYGQSTKDEGIGQITISEVREKTYHKIMWRNIGWGIFSPSYQKITEEQLIEVYKNTSGYAGYSNFTITYTKDSKLIGLYDDTKYKITIVPKWRGRRYKEGYTVWIDENSNGIFEKSERKFSLSPTEDNAVSGYIKLGRIGTGLYRMRISMAYNHAPINPCESFSYGEVEDYYLGVSGKPSSINERTKETNIDPPLNLSFKKIVTLYPNPVQDKLKINTNLSSKTQYMISSANGKTVLNGILKEKVINVSTLKKGIHIIRFIDGNTIISKKFIKK